MKPDTTIYLCPECSTPLELFANGDKGPESDRWTCEPCGIEYPHNRFPLPAAYVQEARALERAQLTKERAAHDRERLAAWNAGEPIKA